jgi:hypothetical protein
MRNNDIRLLIASLGQCFLVRNLEPFIEYGEFHIFFGNHILPITVFFGNHCFGNHCDWKDVVAKKDVELSILNERLKVSNQETLIERQSYSIRAAVETLLLKKYPEKPRKMEVKLQNEDASLKQTYADLCETFNCSNYADKVPSKLYHSLLSKIHGGGYPIRCNIKDSTLSAAEWSFVIAVFKLNLPDKGYSVFDSEENEMDI